MALFERIPGRRAEVWIGLDGSAMGGRTMASSWTDHELSRVITWRSSAPKSSEWGSAEEPALQQRVEKKTDV